MSEPPLPSNYFANNAVPDTEFDEALAPPSVPPPSAPTPHPGIDPRRRYEQSRNLIRERMSAANNGFGPFGVQANWPTWSRSVRLGALPNGTSWTGSKLPACFLVIVVVVVLLYLLSPSFIMTQPLGTNFQDMPVVSHTRVLGLALTAGLFTFLSQMFSK